MEYEKVQRGPLWLNERAGIGASQEVFKEEEGPMLLGILVNNLIKALNFFLGSMPSSPNAHYSLSAFWDFSPPFGSNNIPSQIIICPSF